MIRLGSDKQLEYPSSMGKKVAMITATMLSVVNPVATTAFVGTPYTTSNTRHTVTFQRDQSLSVPYDAAPGYSTKSGECVSVRLSKSDQEGEGNGWTSDFDDFVGSNDDDVSDMDFSFQKFSQKNSNKSGDDEINTEQKEEAEKEEEGTQISKLLKDRVIMTDLSGSSQRQFNLGYDIILSDFAGSMGFDEVVDWEYFDNPGEEKRNVVQPPPFDPTKPKRTRSSSGSVVRIFRGELAGRLGSTIRARGLDRRVLVKEFSGEKAVELAKAELKSIAKLQSALCAERNEDAKRGDWATSAAKRYTAGQVKGSTGEDDVNVIKLLELLGNAKSEAPYVGILGELNIADLEEDDDFDPNEWYRALGVSPPKPDSIWIVYEYAGLSTLGSYARPALVRRANLPMKKGFFGNPVPPPPLPPWKERAKYVVQGVLKGALEAVATLHESGIAHRSIGRSSIILSSVAMDKLEASSPYAVTPSRLVVKLADFGFSGLFEESSLDETFRSRARAFGLDVREGTSTVASTGFAIAEDLHALGFVFLGVLLTSLAELPTETYAMPATDEDSLQRLLGDIFGKDMNEFREYCEAEDVWSNVVDLLDENDGAGWELLSSLCFARERAAENKDKLQLLTARGLLSNALFTGKR